MEEPVTPGPGAAAPADFLRDSQVERDPSAAGRYRALLGGSWNAAYFPFGGMVSALALRAMECALGEPSHRLRTATTVFSSPVESGEVQIDVQVLRAGRGMSQLHATLRNAGRSDPGHTTLAVFGSDREVPPAFEFTELEKPPAPPPEQCPPPPPVPPEMPFSRSTFFEQVETRVVKMRPVWERGWEPEGAEALRWMRYRSEVRRSDGLMDPLALVPVADTMPPSVGQKVGPGQEVFYAPSCDLTLHVFETTPHEWLLLHSRCARVRAGYASCSNEIWDPEGRLLCRATQLMYLRFGL